VTPPRLSALDALARGTANVRANRELVGVQIAGGLLLAASIVVPVLLFLSRLGIPFSIWSANDPEAVRQALESLRLDFGQVTSMLGLGLLLFLVIGTLVFLVYCWIQAGTLAVLSAGDAQAPATRLAPAAVFRTFSWAGFFGWASRYGLRIFWVNNLFMVFLTLALGVLVLPLFLVGRLAEGSGFLVACAAGCGLALPVGFVMIVLVLAMIVAQICVVEEEATVRSATRRAFSITGNRLGGLLLLYLLLIVGSIAVTIAFGGVGFFLKLALSGSPGVSTAVSALLGLVEFLVSTSLGLVLSAAIVALVRAELRREAALARPAA
jgi:hypothetical protein